MSRTSTILTTAAFAAVVTLASIGSAFAQAAAGGGAPSGGGPPGAGSPGGSPVITYGTPGNCPPTIAGCSIPQTPKGLKKPRRIDNCADYPRGSVARRECLAKVQ